MHNIFWHVPKNVTFEKGTCDVTSFLGQWHLHGWGVQCLYRWVKTSSWGIIGYLLSKVSENWGWYIARYSHGRRLQNDARYSAHHRITNWSRLVWYWGCDRCYLWLWTGYTRLLWLCGEPSLGINWKTGIFAAIRSNKVARMYDCDKIHLQRYKLPAGWDLNSSFSVGRNVFMRSHVMVHSWEYPSELENTRAESITNSMFFSDSGIASYCKKCKESKVRFSQQWK
jgi:hypothetical protein